MSKPLYAKFGKYTLLENINTGGMAEILLAVLTGVEGFEKLTAIKRILPHLSANQEFISMFIYEAKLAAQLTHQNIIHIYDFGRIEESYYIAMEYVRGKNLRELIQQCQRKGVVVNIPLALDIVGAVCRGLDYAHRKCGLDNEPLNIVHRDINPYNILISYEGEVKLVDFGIAKAAMHTQETKVGVLKGKVSYMSPEQVSGKPVDGRSDIFSLGIVVYELVTGQRLFRGDSEVEAMLKVKSAQIPPPSKINPGVTQGLERVILKALAENKADRYQNTAEFHADIRRVQDSLGSEGREGLSVFMGRLFQEIMAQENQELAELLGQVKGVDPARTHSALGLPQGAPLTPKSAEKTTVLATPSSRKRPYWVAVLIVGLALISTLGYLGVERVPLKPFIAKLKAKFAPSPQPETPPPDRLKNITAPPPEALPEPELPQPGVIKLHTNIAKAELYVDGEKQDLLTSTTNPVAIGQITPHQTHQLKIVQHGYAPWETSFSIDSGEQRELTAHLEPLPVSLEISSSPPGAMVILDRVFKGKTTPAVLDGLRPHNTYQIDLRLPGYHKWEKKVVPEPGKNIDLGSIVLKLKFTSLTLDSSPSASVFLDRKQVGKTPLKFNKIIPGKEYKLELKSSGYRKWRKTIKVGEDKPIDLGLIQLKQMFGALNLNTIPWTHIYLGDKKLGTTPVASLKLSAGKHTLNLVNPDLEIKDTLEVEIKPDQTTNKVVKFEGELNVNAIPWAEVYVDDQKLGVTPLGGIKLACGLHTIKLVNPSLQKEKEIKVLIRTNMVTTQVVDFTR